jgi:coenzyme F420-0:L-glutamate ligase/coenzyme F420-1:gamma-L-glutamate ligase
VLTERQTVTEFSDKPVDPVIVRRAIEVAMTAPAPPGDRPWRFAVLESAVARQHLVDAMRPAEDYATASSGAESLGKAPLILVACLAREAAPGPAGEGTAAPGRTASLISLGAAIENLLVALAVDGTGSCWVPGPPSFGPAAADALSLPAGWEPIGAIGVGHPAGPAEPRPQPDLADVIVTR